MEKDRHESPSTKMLEEGETESKVFEDRLDENFLKGEDFEKENDDFNDRQKGDCLEKANGGEKTKIEGIFQLDSS